MHRASSGSDESKQMKEVRIKKLGFGSPFFKDGGKGIRLGRNVKLQIK